MFFVLLCRFDFVCVVTCLALFLFVYCTVVTCFISSCPVTGFGSVKSEMYVCMYVS
jgi:hypothetical protein